jgi:hypothetical protein
MTDRKLHVDTLILIPTIKIYVFLYSGRMDGRTDRRTETLIRCRLPSLRSSRLCNKSMAFSLSIIEIQ